MQTSGGASDGMGDEAIGLKAYQDFGEDYAQVIEQNAYNACFERPSTLSLLPPLAGKKILDAGCGPGAYFDHLLNAGANVVGIDVSPAMLDCAKKRYGDRIEVQLHDLAKPLKQFEDGEFDIVLSSLAIHYVQDVESLFNELYRVLRSGGSLVFSTHHPLSDFGSSPSGNYYKTELVKEVWNTVGRPVEVSFYRRPLSALTEGLFRAGFAIQRISEGVLTEALREKFPKTFDRLSNQPQFIFFHAIK